MRARYYGDNLPILQHALADESVDLVYLDPPFNSANNYTSFSLSQDLAASTGHLNHKTFLT